MVDEYFKFVGESDILEVKNKMEDNGFCLEQIIIELSSINEDIIIIEALEDVLWPPEAINRAKECCKDIYHKVKPNIYPIIQAFSACYLRQKERKALWRNGFVGKMTKENDPVKRLSMRLFFHMYQYFYAMEYALKTDQFNYFFTAMKEIMLILKTFHSSSSLTLAKANLCLKQLRKQRGKNSMSEVSASKSDRNNRIKKAYTQFVTDGRQREAAGILASRFNLTATQIRAIVK